MAFEMIFPHSFVSFHPPLLLLQPPSDVGISRPTQYSVPPMSPVLCLFLLIIVLSTTLCSGTSSPEYGHVRLQLIHRHHLGHEAAPPRTRLELLNELAESDLKRWSSNAGGLEVRNRGRVAMEKSSFAMPISSGAYAGTGQYFVRFRVGTSAQPFLLVADTGSDLTWMNCRYRCKNCTVAAPRRSRRQRRVFVADASRTFRPIRCSTSMCKTALPFSLKRCRTPVSPCFYDYSYADGSSAQGFFATESVTVNLATGQKVKFKNLVIGCSSTFVGSSFREADGVLGLGHSRHSFAVKATAQFGGRFSYCLVDHLSPKNASSYLTFGAPPASAKPRHIMGFTKLIVEPQLEPFYAVEVTGISVGGAILKIPRAVWDVRGNGGTVVDSGTSLTMLTEPAYKPLVAALSRSLKGLPRVQMEPFDFCYNTTSGFRETKVPQLTVHFSGGATFKPPVKSYVIATADGVKCLGFLPMTWPGISVIGNILQQNYLWEFDLARRRLGFMPSSCDHEN